MNTHKFFAELLDNGVLFLSFFIAQVMFLFDFEEHNNNY